MQEQTDLRKAYADYYKKETGGRFGFGVELVVKFFRFLRAIKIKLAKSDAKTILDIGSGRGWTLYILKKYFGYQRTCGTQIAENAYQYSKQKLKLEIHNRDLLEIDFGGRFEVITLWHVLEHVNEPEKYLEKIHDLLKVRGVLIIEVPNFNSWARRLTGKYWLAMDPKHHRTFFTPQSLSELLEKHNFRIKKINTFSLEYSAFTSAQSLLNLITRSDGYFFQWLQEGGFQPKIVLHILLFLILFPICLLINLALYFSRIGEIINIFAEKNE